MIAAGGRLLQACPVPGFALLPNLSFLRGLTGTAGYRAGISATNIMATPISAAQPEPDLGVMGGVAPNVTAALLQKKATRQAVKAALKAMSQDDMANESRLICDTLLSSALFKNSRTLGIYVHCARLLEVDTSALLTTALAKGKRCYVPFVQDKASNMQLLHLDDMTALIAAPPYGILEPSRTYPDGSPRQDVLTSSLTLDVLMMPGLGFDKEGNRLGRGGGYYDKAVARLREAARQRNQPPPLLVALAYSAQVVDTIPTSDHDEQIDVLVTSQGAHACTPAGQAALA